MADVGLITNIVGGFFIVVVSFGIGLALIRDQVKMKAGQGRVVREEVRIVKPRER